MTLKTKITEDMKDAMRARDTARLSTIRMLLAAVKQREVDERIELTDADVVAVIEKMIKQRKDSITQFEAGHRADLADIERAETAVLTGYMPAEFSVFRTFDLASPDSSTPQRHSTTVPQQALFLMNGPFAIVQAKAFAARPDVASRPIHPAPGT